MQGPIEVFRETPSSLRALMVAQLRLLGEATVADWEREVFRAVTGRTREDVDWSYSLNHVGYALWLRAFGYTAAELIVRGEVIKEHRGGQPLMVPREVGPLS
jgi:hypothetical protein